MPPRKSAALILAYGSPDGVRALATYLDATGVDVFVHVDRKADLAPFAQVLRGASHVRLISDRINIFWRGFSMLTATKALLDAAWVHDAYDYFMLLSDDALPLLPAPALRDIIASGREFLEASSKRQGEFQERYAGYFMLDSEATQVRWIPLKQREVTPDAVQRINRLHTLRQCGKRPLPALFHGSQWWALNRANIARIRDSWDNDVWTRESFEFSEVPDEHYFQTILGESGTAPPWATFIHTEWNVPEPPRVFTTITDIAARRDCGAPFIRKVRLERDELQRYIAALLP